MTALVLANFPLAFLIFAAMIGIPLWLTFKRPDKAPQYSAAASSTKTVPAYRTASPANARQHVAAHTAVPGRVHATPRRTVRRHETADQRDRVPA